ncbi:hypothetical protein [Halosegnis sp.]|uniref:hypothetical protein n=1 Tax=Halosegnis sp. TaxID=2864959 RepID=UPI0035D4A06B
MNPGQAARLLLVAVLVVGAGCTAVGPAGEPTPEPSETPPTPTPGDHESAMDQPDANKRVQVANEWNQSVTVSVRVVRVATNETVYATRSEVAPGTDRIVYNLTAADPTGVESFQITVTARNTTQSVTIQTNKCYGDAYAQIREDGSLYVYYAIC